MNLLWMNRGLCRDYDQDLWFAPSNTPEAVIARQVCERCPVAAQCLAYGTETSSRTFEGTGIWGGLSAKERRALRRSRRGMTPYYEDDHATIYHGDTLDTLRSIGGARMNDVRGGFTQHDNTHGWRGFCPCSWVGPWRGSMLTEVERDVLEHRQDCVERSFDLRYDGGTYEEGPGGAGNANRDHEHEPVEEVRTQ